MRTFTTHPDQRVALGDDFENDVRSFLLPALTKQTVVLITGEHSFAATPQFHLLHRLIAEAEVTVVKHVTCPENPRGATLEQIATELPAFDQLLAVGGGSVIDAAKKLKHETGSTHPLSVIYTRFGSGTIVTPFFVYDNHEFKIGGHDPLVVPQYVYVSLELMEGLSSEQRLIGVSDILAHAVESYLSTAGDPALKVRAQNLIERLDVDAADWPLERLVECDIEAGLIEGECLVLLPHALGHYLTYAHGVPHGIASIVTLPNLTHLLVERQAMDTALAQHVTKLAESFLIRYEDVNALELRQHLLDEFSLVMTRIRTYMPFAFDLMPIPVSEDDVKAMLTITT